MLTRVSTSLRGVPSTLIYLFTSLVTQLTLSTTDHHKPALLITESMDLLHMRRVVLLARVGVQVYPSCA